MSTTSLPTRVVGRCLIAAMLLLATSGFIHSACSAAEKPNIILVFTDDQGYGDVGCYGAEGFKTPNLDRMAADGMKFTDFYSNCGVCSGSRAALMTGCHYQRVNMSPVLFPRSNKGLHPDEVTIADMLEEQGYATACIGKWHLGHLPPFLPTEQGFDYYYGIPYSNDMWIDPNAKLAEDIKLRKGVTKEQIRMMKKPGRNDVPLMRNDEVIEYPADQDTLTKRYTEEAVRFISEHKDEPFFVYLPHTMPHLPLAVSDSFKGRTKSKFGDIMEEIDWSMGEIFKALKQEGIDDNTLVIFTTDNGTRSGSSGPLRERKASIYEGGVRVPCIMRWPGEIPEGTVCSEITATIDMLPTIAHLTGGEVPQGRVIDGKNIAPLMRGESGATTPHDAYPLAFKQGSVRSGKWKFYPWPENKSKNKKKDDGKLNAPKVQLYDLSEDIGETNNVAGENPEVVARLSKVFADFKADLKENSRPAGMAE